MENVAGRSDLVGQLLLESLAHCVPKVTWVQLYLRRHAQVVVHGDSGWGTLPAASSVHGRFSGEQTHWLRSLLE